MLSGCGRRFNLRPHREICETQKHNRPSGVELTGSTLKREREWISCRFPLKKLNLAKAAVQSDAVPRTDEVSLACASVQECPLRRPLAMTQDSAR